MESDATRMCELLVGLPAVAVTVLGVVDGPGLSRSCLGCERTGWVQARSKVTLVDLPCFGRVTRLVWHKVRLSCPNPACAMVSWTIEDARIAAARMVLTDRAGRWVTEQVGRHGRTVNEVAGELACDWHTVNDAVVAYGEALVDDDQARIGTPRAVGLDETLFNRPARSTRRRGRPRSSMSPTRACWTSWRVETPGRRASGLPPAGPSGWRRSSGRRWTCRARIARCSTRWSRTPCSADPFHVSKLANSMLDEVRRRVQNQTLGHRGRRDDPLFRVRRKLVMAAERHTVESTAKLLALLATGDPTGDVTMAWHAKEVVRETYQHHDVETARAWVDEIIVDFADRSCPPEVRRLGGTIRVWRDQIVAWHQAHLSN